MAVSGLSELSKSDLLCLMDICQESLSCDSPSALSQLLGRLSDLLPSSATLAAKVVSNGPLEPPSYDLVNLSYPQEWMSEYVSKNYFAIDPIKDELMSGTGKVVCDWSPCFDGKSDMDTRHFVSQLREHDLVYGVTMCLKRPNDPTLSFFSFAGREVEDEQRHRAALEYMLPYLHEAYSRTPMLKPVEPQVAEEVFLTPRERDVLSWAMYGKTNVDIADLLNISERTAKFHVQNILGKLNACSRAHAVAIALHKGLLKA